MSDQMEQLDQAVLASLRSMARQGQSPSEMLGMLKRSFGMQPNIVSLLDYFRQAFCLTLAEVKPIAALSRNQLRNVDDEILLDELLKPAILKRRVDWESSRP
jgi:hypothetical protein